MKYPKPCNRQDFYLDDTGQKPSVNTGVKTLMVIASLKHAYLKKKQSNIFCYFALPTHTPDTSYKHIGLVGVEVPYLN